MNKLLRDLATHSAESDVGKSSGELYDAAKALCMIGVLNGVRHVPQREKAVTGLLCGAIAVAGAIEPLALALSREPGGTPISNDEALFAAMLAARVVNHRNDGETCAVQFDPAIVREAMEMFERATGRKADGFLNEGLVEAARNCNSPELAAMRAALLAEEERKGKTIN